MTYNRYKEILIEMEELNPDAIKLDGLDECIIGICETFEGSRLLYSERKIIDSLVSDGMSEEQAIEYFEYNTLGGYFGEYNPVFLRDI